MSDILVFCETADGAIKSTAKELIGKAKALAEGASVTAVLLGADLAGLGGELGGWGADAVLKVQHDALAAYVPGAWASALAQVIENRNPDVVLGSASLLGKDLLPRVAAKLGAGLAADCVDLSVGGDGVEGVRALYAGKCLAAVKVSSSPKFFSVRPNSFVLGPVPAGSGAVEDFSADLDGDFGYEVTGVEQSGGATLELTEATRIISGGRSLKSAENFAIFTEPARVLGAAVGASRAAVDAGYAPHAMQVGQTGKTVNPQLYVACGISGAIQHLAGMRTSKVIVAINKDGDAPIFQHATYGIVGDLFEVVPMLTEELKAVIKD
jgi:electron transfer flavoprotein alpha subunit